ncbi:MAG TPA: redoxin domain-containing protein [Longimicrobiales bacterium]|nr:redoxin domain-containing protein [Longimicrobiales bacterium]
MNWKRSVLAAAAVVPVVLLFYYGMGQDPKDIPSPLPGRAAPAFALNAMGTADTVRLDALKGQIVVLNFWASWCLACRSEHEVLREAAGRYGPRGVKFYGVLYNDTPENGAGYIAEMGGQSYPTLLDPKTRTAIDYGLYGVPETFIIGPDGRVLHKQVGPVTPETFAKYLDPLLVKKEAAR